MHSEKCILQGTDIVIAVIHIEKWMIITKRRLRCGLRWFKLSIHIAIMVIHYRFCWFSYTGTKTRRTLLNRMSTHLWVSFVCYESENPPSSPILPNLQLPLHSFCCALFLSHFISPPPRVASIYLQSRTVLFPRLSDWRSWAKGSKKWALMGGSSRRANCPVNALFTFKV